MSRNYHEYLSKKKCCDSKGRGPIGPTGTIGPRADGITGFTGPQGPRGETGTSRRGETGPTGKNFIIPHPDDADKLLLHVCLEGPEEGVYYRGTGEIKNNLFTTIVLPEYVTNLAYDLTINVSSVYDGSIKIYNCGEVENNTFSVYGVNGSFHWLVVGKRRDIVVEPNKSDIIVDGNGPYLWVRGTK